MDPALLLILLLLIVAGALTVVALCKRAKSGPEGSPDLLPPDAPIDER